MIEGKGRYGYSKYIRRDQGGVVGIYMGLYLRITRGSYCYKNYSISRRTGARGKRKIHIYKCKGISSGNGG